MSDTQAVTVYKPIRVQPSDLRQGEGGALLLRVDEACPRCHGSGYWGRGRGPGSRCFRCGGGGVLSSVERVYSREELRGESP